MDREQRVAGIVGALQHRLQLERLDRVIEGIGLPRHLVLHGGVGLVLEQLGHLQRPGEARVELLPGRDPTLESLDLLHGDPGGVGLAQKPASACEASRVCRRSALAVRSKKVSEFSDPLLQLGEAFDEIGHARSSLGREVTEK